MTYIPDQELQEIVMILGVSIGINTYFFVNKPFSKLIKWIENRGHTI